MPCVEGRRRALVLGGLLALLAGLAAGGPLVAATAPEAHGPALVWKAEGPYEDVKADLVDAIEGRGLVISYVSHASAMLERTAEAVEGARKVYDEAEILLFCKADLSHRLVGSSPHNIVLCPYAIAIYTLAGKPDTVYLAIRKPYQDEPAYEPVSRLLEGIIQETVGD
jgi:uncharacterized protein (DUF302 family)